MQPDPAFEPRGINELYSELWSVYVQRIVRLFAISIVTALVVFAATSAIDAVLPEGPQTEIDTILAAAAGDPAAEEAAQEQVDELLAERFWLETFRLTLYVVASLVVTSITVAAFFYVIGGHYVRGRVSLKEAFAFAMLRSWRLIVVTVAATLAILAVWVALVLAPILINIAFADNLLIAAVFSLVSFFGLVATLPITVYLAVRWAYIWPAVALEGLRPIEALRRSWDLVEGHWLRTAGALVMAVLAITAIELVPTMALSLIGSIGSGEGSSGWTSTLMTAHSSFFSPVIAGPVQAIIVFLLYADIRTRKEAPIGYGPQQLSDELRLSSPPGYLPDEM